jgi:hypothetical protein
MTREEAKFILSALHNNEKERFDPGVTEALRMAESDPDLADWFADLLEADDFISGELGEHPVPPELEGNIRAALNRSSHSPPISRRRMAGGIAAAAALIIAFLGLRWIDRSGSPEPSLASFKENMATTLGALKGVDFVSGDPESVVNFVRSNGSAFEGTIPATLEGGKLVGCRILDWNGHEVVLVCFSREGDNAPCLHLFTIDASAIPGLADGEKTEVSRDGTWVARAWRSGERLHLLLEKVG